MSGPTIEMPNESLEQEYAVMRDPFSGPIWPALAGREAVVGPGTGGRRFALPSSNGRAHQFPLTTIYRTCNRTNPFAGMGMVSPSPVSLIESRSIIVAFAPAADGGFWTRTALDIELSA